MIKLFNAFRSGTSLPKETLQAHIAVIPKEGKDLTSCGSYRPISLLNVDLKIFTKILATKVQQHLPHLIHLHQVGFVPSHEAKDNMIKVLNLLQIADTTHPQCVFLGTDAEKAFDRVTGKFTERPIPDDPAFFLLYASNIPG